MANTYTQLNVHVVFAVKNRENIITKKYCNRLHSFIAGILKNNGHYPLIVGGYKDHVHLFFEFNPNTSLSQLIRLIKSASSKWINDNRFVLGKFLWQEGYSAFTYSKSQRTSVIEYIANQENHHKVKTFREEYIGLLKTFDIDFDTKYVFDFYD